MNQAEILKNLCWYDPRNPDNVIDDFADKLPPRDDCFCDNCFYGRNKLAVEILRLLEREQSNE